MIYWYGRGKPSKRLASKATSFIHTAMTMFFIDDRFTLRGKREKNVKALSLISLSQSLSPLQSFRTLAEGKDDGVFNFILQIISLRLSHTVPTVVHFLLFNTHLCVFPHSLSPLFSLHLYLSLCFCRLSTQWNTVNRARRMWCNDKNQDFSLSES